MNDIPPHIDAIIREVVTHLGPVMVTARANAGLPKPSQRETVFLGQTIIAVATATVASTLMRLPDWTDAESNQAYRWMKDQEDFGKQAGKS